MKRLILSALLAGVAAGVSADEISDAMSRCRAIQDQNERLACFDEASRLIDAVPAAPSAPDAPTKTATESAATTTAIESAPASGSSSSSGAAAAPPAAASTSSSASQPEPQTTATSSGTRALEPVITSDDFGFERKREREGAQEIRSRYDGDFTGWSGDTLFPLENGQVWKQIESGRFSHKEHRPMIVVKRGLFQSFYLKVEGKNRTVRVRRVR